MPSERKPHGQFNCRPGRLVIEQIEYSTIEILMLVSVHGYINSGGLPFRDRVHLEPLKDLNVLRIEQIQTMPQPDESTDDRGLFLPSESLVHHQACFGAYSQK